MTLTGPLVYPPAQHMLRDLRVEFEHGSGESRAWIPAARETADARGHVRTGVLATLVDVIGGGLAALAAAPGWIATADLTLHTLEPIRANSSTTLAAVGRVLRAGRTTVVIECAITGEPDARPAAFATMTFSILERRDLNPVLVAADGDPVRQSMATETSCFDRPLLDAFGIRVVEPGVAELDVTPYVVNSLGAVQGGALATLAELAAESLDPTGLDATVDLQIAYLALAKDGPVRAIARPVGDGVARVEVIDVGRDRVSTVVLARRAAR